MSNPNIIPELTLVTRNIRNLGGTAYLVGGGVIDIIQNREVKDYDIEVYGLSLSSLERLLREMSLPVNLVGKSFGVLKTVVAGLDIDLSIPRTENKIGRSHRDFRIQSDHTLSTLEGSRRRDLTMNALMQNLHTGEIVDHYGGMNDLENGILRHVDRDSFVEDPLRVLRIMQLVTRKGKTVSPDTIELCRSIVNEFKFLASERVFEEFNKLLLKGKKPSIGLIFLRDSGWINHFPELEALIDSPQDPIHHPEGDVWTHTLMVLDNAASIRDTLPEEFRLGFMYGTLLHDIGKPKTMVRNLTRITNHGHDKVGSILAKTFMLRLTNETKLINFVRDMVQYHMRAAELTRVEAPKAAWRRLHNKFPLDILGHFTRCDHAGRLGHSMADENPSADNCFRHLEEFGNGPIKPIVTGKDLIDMGYTPGVIFKELLSKAYEAQMEGIEDKEELIRIMLSDN